MSFAFVLISVLFGFLKLTFSKLEAYLHNCIDIFWNTTLMQSFQLSFQMCKFELF